MPKQPEVPPVNERMVINLEKYAVVMAGGSDSRLWPLSRESKPKQFIRIQNDQCMLLKTINRLHELVPLDHIYIVTNRNLLEITQETVKNLLPSSNILLEPSRKNTAACILYAALLLEQKFGDGLLCFVPADGLVRNIPAYCAALDQAYRAAEETGELVVIGITPTYPATGYGYIHLAEPQKDGAVSYPVDRFTEKPDQETAVRFVASKEYFWNSGILTGRISAILDSSKQHLPEHYHTISAALHPMDGQNSSAAIESAYNRLQSISFDYGVLEKAHSIRAVVANFDWDDIGNLDALSQIFQTDENGNSVSGKFCGMDTKNSVIYSDGAVISAIGVENMLVASTGDAVLVCPRERVQEIKNLVDKLKTNGFEALT
ncbi:MAG: Mannose-1-phosphate guanylyltransferase [Eubacteriales bacterium]